MNQVQPATGQDDVKTVKRLLTDIINLFARAKNMSTDFKAERIGIELLVYDESADLDTKYAIICQHIMQLALQW